MESEGRAFGFLYRAGCITSGRRAENCCSSCDALLAVVPGPQSEAVSTNTNDGIERRKPSTPANMGRGNHEQKPDVARFTP
jgi:hypothetical protein